MRILLLGSGGREHALAWAISASPLCDVLICAPGNPGMASVATCRPLDIMDNAAVVALAKAERIDFVVVGPDNPLANGVVDALTAAGIKAFGPPRPPHSLNPARASPRISAPISAFRPPAIAASPARRLPRLIPPITPCPSSSRLTAWRSAKAW